ncbi:MAG: hypothetical protein O7D32_03020 [bacterium]|nr:hypothetical protein [bacterium]
MRLLHGCVRFWTACSLLSALLVQSRAAAQEVKIDPEGTVELHAADMPVSTVLRMLSVRGRRNIIASPSVQGNVTADLYEATFEQALSAILIPLGCDYQIRGNMIHVFTVEELVPQAHRLIRLNYIRAMDVVAAIEPLLSERGTITTSPAAQTGIRTNREATGGDSLTGNDFVIVYDYPERLEHIAAMVEQIDERPRQVLIEATILRTRLTDDNALGVDFTFLGGVDFVSLTADSAGIDGITIGDVPAAEFGSGITKVSTDFAANVPDGGLSIGIIWSDAAVFVRALEEISDTTVIANPKILALNKQVGTVHVGRRDGYLTTTVTETAAVQKVEFLETGTQLSFRPFIGTDGFVRMELHPEDSVGGLTTAELPFEQTTEVTTTVIVQDGHTILIGGLFREVNDDSRAQIPLLGDIPIAGNVFRSRNDSLEREEVIILLTVRIIKDDAEFARHSAEQLDEIERMRVGARRGMMWGGRESLAQALYREAIQNFAQRDDDKALWNVNLALYNHPTFVDAIKLKEEIEQAREWDDDGTAGRNFVRDLISSGEGIDTAPFGRPAPPFERNTDTQPNSDEQ